MEQTKFTFFFYFFEFWISLQKHHNPSMLTIYHMLTFELSLKLNCYILQLLSAVRKHVIPITSIIKTTNVYSLCVASYTFTGSWLFMVEMNKSFFRRLAIWRMWYSHGGVNMEVNENDYLPIIPWFAKWKYSYVCIHKNNQIEKSDSWPLPPGGALQLPDPVRKWYIKIILTDRKKENERETVQIKRK